MFSTLRQGSVIYILDKSSEPTLKTGYVESVSIPRPMYKTFNPAVSFGMNAQTVVDISVKTDNNSFEVIDTYSNTKGYVVARIKKKKWKSIQMKFNSNKPFKLFSSTLESFVGGYVKR